MEPGEQLLTVTPLDQVWITANFKETQLKQMRVGQKATIELDSNGRTYNAHVDGIAGGTGPIRNFPDATRIEQSLQPTLLA